MAKEYIERRALTRKVRYIIEKHGLSNVIGEKLKKAIEDSTAADVVEVKHGEWGKEKWMHTDQHICSLCHSTVRVHPQSVEYRYCPYCGAKMDGERKE